MIDHDEVVCQGTAPLSDIESIVRELEELAEEATGDPELSDDVIILGDAVEYLNEVILILSRLLNDWPGE